MKIGTETTVKISDLLNAYRDICGKDAKVTMLSGIAAVAKTPAKTTVKVGDLLVAYRVYRDICGNDANVAILSAIAAAANTSEEEIELLLDDTVQFSYKDYHFVPFRPFNALDGDFYGITKHLRHDLDFLTADKGYRHSAFYKAVPKAYKHYDIFQCVENGKLYVPCPYDLAEYVEDENE